MTGMGEFNSDGHYIYYCGQESLRRNGVALTVNKRLKCSTCVQSQNDRINSVHFQGKSFNVMVIQVYAPITNAEEGPKTLGVEISEYLSVLGIRELGTPSLRW